MGIQSRPLSGPTACALGLIALILIAGCEQLKSLTDSDEQTAVATIGVYGTPAGIAPGGASTITVIVLDTRDKPARGVTVALSTTLGTLDQTNGQTNGSGTFVTILRTSPTDRGLAYIRVQAGSLWYETAAVYVG